jgi:hypothetical protein
VELKNMQTLYIKIFEFKTETYYKKILQEFSPDINIVGLVASNEKVVDSFKDGPSTKKFIETFNFLKLSNRVGLFIIEFIGNGVSSRVVIKKAACPWCTSRPSVATPATSSMKTRRSAMAYQPGSSTLKNSTPQKRVRMERSYCPTKALHGMDPIS